MSKEKNSSNAPYFSSVFINFLRGANQQEKIHGIIRIIFSKNFLGIQQSIFTLTTL